MCLLRCSVNAILNFGVFSCFGLKSDILCSGMNELHCFGGSWLFLKVLIFISYFIKFNILFIPPQTKQSIRAVVMAEVRRQIISQSKKPDSPLLEISYSRSLHNDALHRAYPIQGTFFQPTMHYLTFA